MEPLTIFVLQLVMSVLVYALITKWYVAPWLAEQPIDRALAVLTLPHAFRHLGMVFLVPGVVDPALPSSFANMAAYGDLASALLAVFALTALRLEWRRALLAVWLFNIVGTVDLLNALSNAQAVPYLGAAWYIPTFVVPLLLVTHAMIFTRLLSSRRSAILRSPIDTRDRA